MINWDNFVVAATLDMLHSVILCAELVQKRFIRILETQEVLRSEIRVKEREMIERFLFIAKDWLQC